MIPTQALISSVVNPQQRGGFMSINGSVQQLATGFAALLGGFIVVKNPDGHLLHYDWVGYFSIALILVSVWLAGRVKPVD